MIRVENKRTGFTDVVLEDSRDALVPTLRHARGILDGYRSFWIEMDLIVRRRKDVKVQLLILHLIPTKVLRHRWKRHPGRHRHQETNQTNGRTSHGTSREWK